MLLEAAGLAKAKAGAEETAALEKAGCLSAHPRPRGRLESNQEDQGQRAGPVLPHRHFGAGWQATPDHGGAGKMDEPVREGHRHH